jgi:hypothetical protein
MLVNPKFKRSSSLESLPSFFDPGVPEKIVDGIYYGFNAIFYLAHGHQRPYEYNNPDGGPGSAGPYKGISYGVCDNWEQIIEQAPNLLTCPEKLVIFLGEVVRKDQSPEGGWRWHKWGPYIGTQNPQCEYIYDEEGIEKVYCYHIVRLFDDEIE